jgi:D-amino-acid dehydrogenase
MRVVVIGAGAIGLNCAYALERAGAEVNVLDSAGIGAGASRRNAGWIVPTMSGPVPAPGMVSQSLRWMARRDSPLRIRPRLNADFVGFMWQMLRNCNPRQFEAGLSATLALNEGTFAAFDALAADGVQFEHHQRGLYLLFSKEENLHHHAEELRSLTELGWAESTVLDHQALQAAVPQLSDNVVGGIDCPGERYIDPNSFVDGLAAVLTERGVAIHTDAQVTAVERGPDGRANAVIAGQRWPADAFVVAAGVGSGAVSSLFGGRVRVQPGKGYGFDLSTPAEPFGKALYLAEGKVALTPLDDRVRLSGTMEFGTDRSVDAVRANGILATTRQYLSGWPEPSSTAGAAPWSGQRPMTPDGLPIIGPLPDQPNVVIATGHAMLGITLSPVTGQLVSDMVLDGAVPPAAVPFRVDR